MKKLSILLLGALIAMTALQGCSKDETTTPEQAVDQTSTDTPTQPNDWAPDGQGRNPIARVELALGGGNGDEPVFNVVHNPSFDGTVVDDDNLSETPDSMEFGIGVKDVRVTGNGIMPTGGACPNSVDPATGLPWATDPCSTGRGTFAGGVISATLTIQNITGAAGNLAACANPQVASCHDWSPVDTDGDGDSSDDPDEIQCDALGGALCTEGSLGACDGFWYTDSAGDAFQDMPNSICVYDRDCSPRRALVGAVPPLPPLPINKDEDYAYCMGSIVILGAIGNDSTGFCEDGITTCGQATSDDDGQNSACGAGTCSNDPLEFCAFATDCPPAGNVCTIGGGGCVTVANCPMAGACSGPGPETCNLDADCPGVETCVGGDTCVPTVVTCNGVGLPAGAPASQTAPWAADARHECWTGCGVCDNGRDFNCVGLQYTGSQATGGPTDLDALGLVKCSGGPYTAFGADVNHATGAALLADTWMIGNAGGGIDMGATLAPDFNLQINSTNSSYCIHTFTIWEDPYGDAAAAECRTTCGDGYIATQGTPSESCEPVDDRAGYNNDRGCSTFGGANPCSLKGVCSDNGAPCNCGPNGDGCGGAGIVADNLALCAVPGTATCNAAVARDCLCDPLSCTGCVDLVTTCGNSILDAGEDCDPGLDPVCCNPATCLFAALGAACGVAPAGACDAQDTCTGINQICVANNQPDGTPCLAAGANPTCDPADTCLAGACPVNVAALGVSCSAEPDCNSDVCDGAGACTDVAPDADGTACTVPAPGDTCCSAACVVGPCPAAACTITSLTLRGNGSAGQHTTFSAGGPDTIDAGGGDCDPVGVGMTYDGSHLAAVDYFMSFPNEPGITELSWGGATLTDYVWFDAQQDNANVDCTDAPSCFVGAAGATEFAAVGNPANQYTVYAAGPNLGIVGNCNQLTGAGCTYPGIASIAVPMTLTCCPGGSALCGAPFDAGPANTVPTSIAINVGMANGGPIDMIFPAAGGAKNILAFAYCGDDPMGCDTVFPTAAGYGAVSMGFFYDHTKWSGGTNNISRKAGPGFGNQYSFDGAQCNSLGGEGIDVSQSAVGFVFASSSIQGAGCHWQMANPLNITLTAGAQPSGTISSVGISLWDTSGWAIVSFSNQSGPSNATLDAVNFTLPITNGEATILWQ